MSGLQRGCENVLLFVILFTDTTFSRVHLRCNTIYVNNQASKTIHDIGVK